MKKIIALVVALVAALTLGAGLVSTASASSLPIVYNGNDWTHPSAVRTTYLDLFGVSFYKVTWSHWNSRSAYGHGWVEGSSGWKYASLSLYGPATQGRRHYFSRVTARIPVGGGYTSVQHDSYNGIWHYKGVCLPRPRIDC